MQSEVMLKPFLHVSPEGKQGEEKHPTQRGQNVGGQTARADFNGGSHLRARVSEQLEQLQMALAHSIQLGCNQTSEKEAW